MSNATLSVTLYLTAGASDKEYQISMEAKDGGYVVNYANGRRGSALRTGTKTNDPVPYDKAKAIYDKLLKSKISGGYTQAESGARYVGTDLEERDSGLTAMLPSPITMAELKALISNSAYGFQEKLDGENRQILIDLEGLKGVNRRGLFCSIREEWLEHDLVPSNGRTLIAGEDMGDHFAAFDIMEIEGRNVADLNMVERHKILTQLNDRTTWMVIVPMAVTQEEKAAMLKKVEAEGGEGIVAKKLSAPYTGGRSPDHLKMKFQESATFVVTRVNAQRSVRLGLYDKDGHVEDLGNVTIPANHDVPTTGDTVEVEYMMRYEGGALMQPKYKGKRTDVDPEPSIRQITRIKQKKAV